MSFDICRILIYIVFKKHANLKVLQVILEQKESKVSLLNLFITILNKGIYWNRFALEK